MPPVRSPIPRGPEQAEKDATRARQAEAAAVARAEHALAAAANETARICADHQQAFDQLTTAVSVRITALEETRDALRVRADRAESDLDAARAENHRLAEQLTQAANAEANPEPASRLHSEPHQEGTGNADTACEA